MVKLVRKFVTEVRMSKLNAVKYSGILSFIIFGTMVTYRNLMGRPIKEAVITSGIASLVLFVALYFTCFSIVRYIDKQDAKDAAKKQMELEERRRRLQERSGKKVNNKKKKKNRQGEA